MCDVSRTEWPVTEPRPAARCPVPGAHRRHAGLTMVRAPSHPGGWPGAARLARRQLSGARAREVTVIVTLPPRDSRIQPLIGRMAVPCSVTTAVAPSIVPVCGTTDHAVMPGGLGARAR